MTFFRFVSVLVVVIVVVVTDMICVCFRRGGFESKGRREDDSEQPSLPCLA